MKSKLILSIILLTSCSQFQPQRFPNSESESESVKLTSSDENKLVYITFDQNNNPQFETIDRQRWSNFQPGGRDSFLNQFFFANTKLKSNSGKKHLACFLGSADSVKDTFFSNKIEFKRVSKLELKSSTSQKVLGLKYVFSDVTKKKEFNLHFRLPHCESGKNAFQITQTNAWLNKSTLKDLKLEEYAFDFSSLITDSKRQPSSLEVKANGFVIDDPISNDNISLAKRLPRFKIHLPEEKSSEGINNLPWTGLDMANKEDSLKFSLLVQKYFYEGMINQNLTHSDWNFRAEKNKIRTWCHMPYLNVGVNGREAIHGLTKEKDLIPSAITPYKSPTPGSNWGVAFFNGPGCETIKRVFGSSKKPLVNPNFSKAVFDDKTVIIKILFTSAQFENIKEAFQISAHISGVGETARKIQTVRHIQMDIAVKDSTLKNTKSDLNGWVMSGFYFDPSYDYLIQTLPHLKFKDKNEENLFLQHPIEKLFNANDLSKAKLTFAGLFKMRPMGVQYGLESEETLIFAGSETNGAGGRLNGPADNKRSSCMGCHATAGTEAKMIPGFLSQKMLSPFIGKLMLDMNQQFALAQENLETQPD